MRIPCRVCAVLFFIGPVLAFALQSQSSKSALHSDSPGSTQDAPKGLIKLDIAVTDKTGKPVSGLEQADFSLLDNGQPGKIVSFHAIKGVPGEHESSVEILLVIDDVNLPPERSSRVRREFEKFLRDDGGHLAHPVSIYRLSSFGLSASEQPSTNGNSLADEITHDSEPHTIWQLPRVTEGPHGNWGSEGSLGISRTEFSLKAFCDIAIENRQDPARKLLIWPGSGWPVGDGSVPSFFDWVTEFSTRSREARMAVFNISPWFLPDTEFSHNDFLKGPRAARDVEYPGLSLQVLATQSGGQVLSSNDLAGLIAKCATDAEDDYSISFDPARTITVDDYHELTVSIDKPGLIARTRSGYYDEPVYQDQPDPEAKQLTVNDLGQLLRVIQNSGDADLARQLLHVQLSERLSNAKLAQLEESIRGKKSKAALVALADQSAFLAPPAADIPTMAPPGQSAQKQMLSLSVDYVNKTISRLPDFFAKRTTIQYHGPTPKEGQTWKTIVGDQSLGLAEVSNVTVLFRNGKEQTVSERKNPKIRERDLVTVGTFGPLLAMAIVGTNAPHSDVTWSRWEQTEDSRAAVFTYVVPHTTPLFEVGFCCLADDEGTTPFARKVGFHGEIAIDPASGAVLRLTVEADLDARLPLEHSAIMVEYAPQTIGGKTYICPARSVSVSRQRTVSVVHEWGESFRVYGPFVSLLNDVTFGNYHLFRSESRVLPDYTPVPNQE